MKDDGDDFSDVDPLELAKTLEDLDDLDSNLFKGSKRKMAGGSTEVRKTPQAKTAEPDKSKSSFDNDFLFGDYAPSSAGPRTQEGGRRGRGVRFSQEETEGGFSSRRSTPDIEGILQGNGSNRNNGSKPFNTRQTSSESASRQRSSLDWLDSGFDTKSNSKPATTQQTQNNRTGSSQNQRSPLDWLEAESNLFDNNTQRSRRQDTESTVGTAAARRGRRDRGFDDLFGDADNVDAAPEGRAGRNVAADAQQNGKLQQTDESKKNGDDWLQLKRKFESKSTPSQSPPQPSIPVAQAAAVPERHQPADVPKPAVVPTTLPPQQQIQVSNVTIAQRPENVAISPAVVPTLQPPSDEVIRLEGKVKSLEMECKYLKESLEHQQKIHEEEIKAMNALHEKQVKTLEDSYQQKEQSLRSGFEYRLNMLESQLRQVEERNRDLVVSYQDRMKELEKERSQEMLRLKELHDKSILSLKEEHEDAIKRLKAAKEREIETLSNTQVYAKSIQAVLEQLQKRTKELQELEGKLDEKDKAAYLEKFARLEMKEKQLKALEAQLNQKMEASDEERSRLQQLVLSLEARDKQQTKEIEKERWNLQQERGKLQVQLRFLEEERKQLEIRSEQERRHLQKAKEILLEERRNIMAQITEERERLAKDREAWEALKNAQMEEDLKAQAEQRKKKSEQEAEYYSLLREKENLEREYQKLQHSVEHLREELRSLEKERQEIAIEKEKLLNMAEKLRNKSKAIEELYGTAVQTKEEGKSALQKAKQIESNHHFRLEQIQNQLEMLRNQERHLIETQKMLAEESSKLANRRDVAASGCAVCQFYGHQNFANNSLPSVLYRNYNVPLYSKSAAFLPPEGRDVGLDLWKIDSKKDKEFLDHEMSFLETLQRSSSPVKYS